MTPDRRAVCDRVLRWRSTVDAANTSGTDPWLVLAVIAQESAGDPCAIRVEPDFYLRYKSGIIADLAKAGMARWARFPDLVSASYGLCQVMFPVALERGIALAFPTSLCDPEIGIRAGIAQLRYCFSKVPAGTTTPIVEALSRYNGGADSGYAPSVQAWRADLMEVVADESTARLSS